MEVLAVEGILFIRESAHEHPLDFHLPGQFLELRIVKEYFPAGYVVFVQFDHNVTREFAQFRVSAGETHDHGFGNCYAVALEGQIYRTRADDGIYLTKPGSIAHRLIRSATLHFYLLQVEVASLFHADIVKSKADHDEVVQWRSRHQKWESDRKTVEKLA
jgi:hypothetical protein